MPTDKGRKAMVKPVLLSRDKRGCALKQRLDQVIHLRPSLVEHLDDRSC